MALPTRDNVQTLDYSLGGQPAAFLEAKALSPASTTLDYSFEGQPIIGLSGATPPVVQNSAFLIFFNGI